MKKSNLILSILICCITIIVISCNPQPKDVTDEIADANLNFMQAFDDANAEALAACYTADAKLFPSNSDVITGQENIQWAFQGYMDMGISKAVLETVYAEAYGNTAIEEGRYTLYAGDMVADQGKYIVIWKKVANEWKLFKDIFNTSNVAPIQRAVQNDTVWIIENRIKANKVVQFEDFNFNYLEPATMSIDPQIHNSVRTLKPFEPNKDGTYSYYYLMDPVIPFGDYDMMTYLTAQYGEEKAGEYIKMFTDCLVEGQQNWTVTTQTKW